jgi:hypothetical protein
VKENIWIIKDERIKNKRKEHQMKAKNEKQNKGMER